MSLSLINKTCVKCGNTKMKLYQSPISDVYHCVKCGHGIKDIHLDKALSYKAVKIK